MKSVMVSPPVLWIVVDERHRDLLPVHPAQCVLEELRKEPSDHIVRDGILILLL